MTNDNILYRVFNSDGELLYIGATTNPGLRIQNHARLQPWWDEATNITLERLPNRDALRDAETAAIAAEHPRYNLIHSKHYPWSEKPRRPYGAGSIFRRKQDGLWIGSIEVGAGSNGKRKQRRVSGKSKSEVVAKLELLRIEREG